MRALRCREGRELFAYVHSRSITNYNCMNSNSMRFQHIKSWLDVQGEVDF